MFFICLNSKNVTLTMVQKQCQNGFMHCSSRICTPRHDISAVLAEFPRHPPTLGSHNASRQHFLPKVRSKYVSSRATPLTLGSCSARRTIFIPKVTRKIRFLAGYPLTLGSQNAGAAISLPKVSRKMRHPSMSGASWDGTLRARRIRGARRSVLPESH